MKKLLIFVFIIFAARAEAALTLKECLDLALASNLRVVEAQEKVNAARAKFGQATGNFLPRVSLSASSGLNYYEPASIILPASLGGGSFSSSPNEASNITSYSLSVQQTLFTGGKILSGWAIARVTFQAEQEQLRAVKNETTMNVTAAFYELLKAKKSLELINESLANLKRNLELTTAFYNSGINSNLDLSRAQTQYANLEISRIGADNGVRLARLAFDNIVGNKLEKDFVLKEAELETGTVLKMSQEEVLKTAYANRPEWKAFGLAMEAAKTAVNLNVSGFLPTLAYSYAVGRTVTTYPTATTSNSNLSNWRSMVVGSWSLFDGFDTANKILEARANYNAAKAQQQSVKDGIALEVNSAYYNLLSAGEKVTASITAAEYAEKAFKIAEVNYSANIISEQQYLDTSTANQAAKLNLWSAKYDYETAKAKLNKAVGKEII